MRSLSRREFGKIVMVGAPLALGVGRSTPAVAGSRVTLGVSTSSFRDLPRVTGRDNVDDVIRALQAVGATHIELDFANVEPAPPDTGPRMGGTPAYPQLIVLTPGQIAAIKAQARAALRVWRSRTDLDYFAGVGRKLTAAGLTVHACSLTYDDSFTDEEIDTTFRQVKALGASTVSSPMTMATAARLAPVAARHQLTVAIHNQVDGNPAGAIGTGQLSEALALSPAFRLTLDVGNLTASNGDAVAELREREMRVSHVIVKDRLRNGGASQHFGEGDTPIPAVLDLLETSRASIPALVEYRLRGLVLVGGRTQDFASVPDSRNLTTSTSSKGPRSY